MRIACIYWYTSSVGGIATHLNSLRTAAIREGDQFDILHTRPWKTKRPQVFKTRQWVRGGDTRIWIDGEFSHDPSRVQESIKWLEQNYDAILFGFICPHKRKDYPKPLFLPIYDVDLPKAAWVMDGYWHEYSEWAEPLLGRLSGVLCPQESYASPLRELGYKKLVISPFPFVPFLGKRLPKDETPLLAWTNQWKDIKGIGHFLKIVPKIPPRVQIEMYSNGIRYYQFRTEDFWRGAVREDKFQGYNGTGRATFFGNVDLPEIIQVYQRAWFTCNLQGMTARNNTYKLGSYNNTEVEALYYGACPILHSSSRLTAIPKEVYQSVDSADEIPDTICRSLKSGFALDEERREKAREFVIRKHLASSRYKDVRELLQ
jgi:glycosyltransferase involved in cell wall biosynthesis